MCSTNFASDCGLVSGFILKTCEELGTGNRKQEDWLVCLEKSLRGHVLSLTTRGTTEKTSKAFFRLIFLSWEGRQLAGLGEPDVEFS